MYNVRAKFQVTETAVNQYGQKKITSPRNMINPSLRISATRRPRRAARSSSSSITDRRGPSEAGVILYIDFTEVPGIAKVG